MDEKLIARLRDYHDQVLKGFRHISRLEEAELIRAAIAALSPQELKVLNETALTLRNILDDERGEKQPIGRLMWLLKLCIERIDLMLAKEKSNG